MSSGFASIAFGEEIADQSIEARAVLDLRPVPALSEHVQLRARNPLRQRE